MRPITGGMTTATSFTPTPVALIRPDKSRQVFASLRDAASYYDSLVVAAGGVSKRPETFIGNISKASRTGKLAYGFRWERAEATSIRT